MTWRRVLITVMVVAVVAAGCGDGDSATTTTSAVAGATATTTSGIAPVEPTTSPETPRPSREEIRFQSGGFELVGDLHLPGGEGLFGGVILVPGSGGQTRDSAPSAGLIPERFLDAGYAVLSWDKPGSGESRGQLSEEYELTELATILTDGILLLAEHPAVDPDRIGLWGLSQAGWVMPMALTMTDQVSFMIVVSGGGEDSIEQMVYGWERKAACSGASEEEVAIMQEHGPAALKATSYDEHRAAMERLLAIPDLDRYVGLDVELAEPEDWSPWPRDIDAFFDPMTVIEQTTIPVLAIFGGLDVQVDPIQGAEAYRAALERAGNPEFRVELIPDVGHTLKPASAHGCASGSGGYSPRYLELIDEWIERLQGT